MAWSERYSEQAEAHRREAKGYAAYGNDRRAQFHRDCADVYDKLREQAVEFETRGSCYTTGDEDSVPRHR